MIYIIIAFLIALADRTVKALVESRIGLGESYQVIENVLYMTRSKNTGVAFGAFQDGGLILKISTSLLIIVVIYMMYSNKNKIARLGFTSILGGALGNFYDRIFHNGVTDFIDIPPLWFIFPNFNVADIFIVAGTIIVAIYLLFIDTKTNRNKDNAQIDNVLNDNEQNDVQQNDDLQNDKEIGENKDNF